MTTPKEIGALFNGDMVRAIMRGDKTQTRRLVKPMPPSNHDWRGWVISPFNNKNDGAASWGCGSDASYAKPLLGGAGDKVFVRETFAENKILPLTDKLPGDYIYRADLNEQKQSKYAAAWTPSIHMPKIAARIWLEITGVKVQRLQDITADEAIAEGVEGFNQSTGGDDYQDYWRNYMAKEPDDWQWPWFAGDPVKSFASLWVSIYGQESWDSNPWIFAYEFKIISNIG